MADSDSKNFLKDSSWNCSTGVVSGYLSSAKADAFPHVNAVKGSSAPGITGTVKEFCTDKPDDWVEQMRNRIKKCSGCGKPNGYTLGFCNQCGNDLSSVEISYSDNVFTAFVYGIQKCAFPLTISIRHQTEDLLVFDDLMQLSPTHFVVIPTDVFIPDFRTLFTRPIEGCVLVQKLFDAAWDVFKTQFLSNEEWVQKMLQTKNLGEEGLEAALKKHVISGMNFPPSQYQLHLQFIVPPMTPFHYQMYLEGKHYTFGRFFPYEFLVEALDKCDPIPDAADMAITDLLAHLPVDYADIFHQCYERYGKSQGILSNFQSDDFENLVLTGPFLNTVMDISTMKVVNLDVSEIGKKDKLTLQNYGRPYSEKGRPTGSYYTYFKKEKLSTFAEK